MRFAILLPLVLVLVVLAACGNRREPSPSDESAVDAPTRILRAWDTERAAAYAAGSEVALRAIYTPGSTAADGDVALLQQYVARDLVVSGMRTQVLALDVLHESADELKLLVTDRLVGAIATGPSGQTPLPHDQASTHEVVLRKIAGQWLMDSVS